jgi:hypothetical protein
VLLFILSFPFLPIIFYSGPLRNFMMTTTFELLQPDSTERVLQWQSDENLVVRVQLKLKNNYSKVGEGERERGEGRRREM